MESSVSIMEIPVIRYIPEFLAWVVGIVLGAIMVKKGGGRAEKLMLAGCCVMAFNQIFGPLVREIVTRLIWTEAMSIVEKGQALGWASFPMALFTLAGLICLIWGFWVKFKRGKQVTA